MLCAGCFFVGAVDVVASSVPRTPRGAVGPVASRVANRLEAGDGSRETQTDFLVCGCCVKLHGVWVSSPACSGRGQGSRLTAEGEKPEALWLA